MSRKSILFMAHIYVDVDTATSSHRSVANRPVQLSKGEHLLRDLLDLALAPDDYPDSMRQIIDDIPEEIRLVELMQLDKDVANSILLIDSQMELIHLFSTHVQIGQHFFAVRALLKRVS